MTRHWPTCSTLDSILYSRTSARFCRDDARKCERDVAKFNRAGSDVKAKRINLNREKLIFIVVYIDLYSLKKKKEEGNRYFRLIFVEKKKKIPYRLKFPPIFRYSIIEVINLLPSEKSVSISRWNISRCGRVFHKG